MPGGVQHIQRDVGHLERAVLLHLDLGQPVAIRLAPGQPVLGMQRYRGLVPLGHRGCRPGVGPVAVRADHRDDLPVADHIEHRDGVLARVDDDHLFVVADHPGVAAGFAGLNSFDSRIHRDALSGYPPLTKARIAPTMSWTAIAESSRPAIRVSNSTPLGRSSR